MTFTLTLSADQMAELARAVAVELGGRQNGAKSTCTVKEAARMIGVDPCTIRRRIKAGLIPTVPGFHSVRIPRSHIDTLLGSTPGTLE